MTTPSSLPPSLSQHSSLPSSYLSSSILSISSPSHIDPTPPLEQTNNNTKHVPAAALLPAIQSKLAHSHTSASSVALLSGRLHARTSETAEMVKYLDSEVRRKDLIIKRLTGQLEENKQFHESDLAALSDNYRETFAATERLFMNKEAAYLAKQQALQQQITQLADYKKLREKLIKQLENTKFMIIDKAKLHKAELEGLERKFLEEKEKLFNETIHKINKQFHGDAASEGGQSGKSSFRQLISSELASEAASMKREHQANAQALQNAERKTNKLTKTNTQLKEEIRQLNREIELLQQQERMYAGKFRHEELRLIEAGEEVKALERGLMAAIQQAEHVKESAQSTSLTIIEPLAQSVKALKQQARSEERETLALRREAARIIDEKRAMQEFFIDMINDTQRQIKQEQQNDDTEKKAKLKENLSLLARPGGAARVARSLASAGRQTRPERMEQLEERERLLRLLYAKACKITSGLKYKLPPNSFDPDAPGGGALMRLMPAEHEQ